MGEGRRDWFSPQYKQWRNEVYKRDKWHCRKCGSAKRLNAHHIKRWANYPSLRYEVSNGITLCYRCHKAIEGCEDDYVGEFMRLVAGDIDFYLEIQQRLRKMRNAEDTSY